MKVDVPVERILKEYIPKNLGCVVKVKICQELRFTAFGRQPTTRLYQSKWKGLEISILESGHIACTCSLSLAVASAHLSLSLTRVLRMLVGRNLWGQR